MDKKKEIAILTWLHNRNYGSILQAYALQKYLRKQGFRVFNVDYCPTTIEKIRNLILSRNSILLFKEKWEAYQLKRSANPEKWNIKNSRFDEFLKREFSLTKRFTKRKRLVELNNKYDVFICGSDQIWSPMLLNPVYYLSFLVDDSKKIAYAASFGVAKIPEKKKDRIVQYIRKFDAISVREYQGKKIINELINEDVDVVIDPTMLLTCDDWDEIAEEKIIEGKYVLLYFLSYNEEYYLQAKAYANKLGCKLVAIATVKELHKYEDCLAEDVGPREWLSLIKYSTVVITDSFHGCVFSILYEKEFYVFKRFSDKDKKSQNSRIYTLLETYGLEHCLMEKEIGNGYCLSEEKCEEIYQRVKEKRILSRRWLDQKLR